MMDFAGLTVDEIIEYLFKEQDHISTTDIVHALDSCSAADPYAGKDALTIFYSGGEDEIVNEIAKTNNSRVRLIRRTDGYKLMTSSDGKISFDELVRNVIERENPSLSALKLDEAVSDFLYKSSAANDPSLKTDKLGLWTRLSSRFADETKGNAYSLCPDAAENRIFSRDELKHWISTASDDASMNGITKSDLVKLSGTDRFERVLNIARNDLANTELTLRESINSGGSKYLEKVGRTFKGSSLEKYLPDIISKPSGKVFKLKATPHKTIAK